MKSLKCIVMAFLMILSAAFFSACNANSSQIIIVNVYDEVRSLDPLLASNPTEIAIANAAFYNLFMFNDDGGIVTQAAKSYEFSSGANPTLTIELRQNLYWANGDKLTADCFLFSLQRAVKLGDDSPLAFYLGVIENARDIMDGILHYSELGINTNGNYGLRINFEYGQTNENFLHTLTLPITAPTNRAFFENTRGRYGLTYYHTLTNGAYAFTTFSEELVRLRPRENYNGILANRGINIAINDSDVDTSGWVASRHAHVAIGPNFAFVSDNSLPFLEFYHEIYALHTNPANTYLNGTGIHRALNLAIDNAALEVRFNGIYTATCNLAAQDMRFRGLEISNEILRGWVRRSDSYGRDYYYNTGNLSHEFNPAWALERFQVAFPTGVSMPNLTLIFEDVPQMQLIAAEIAQSWQAHLNFHVRIIGLNRAELLRRIESENFDIALRPISVPNACLVALSHEFSDISKFTAAPQNAGRTWFTPTTNFNEMNNNFERFNSNFTHDDSMFTPLFQSATHIFYQPNRLNHSPVLHPNGHINLRRLQ